MKVSAKEKTKTRKRILQAASDVIIEKGFKAATMREIARRAEVGDATIYNYFPSKEKLLYGFCEQKQDETAEALKSISDFHQYSLKVTTSFSIPPCTPMAYTSFSRPTDLSRIIGIRQMIWEKS